MNQLQIFKEWSSEEDYKKNFFTPLINNQSGPYLRLNGESLERIGTIRKIWEDFKELFGCGNCTSEEDMNDFIIKRLYEGVLQSFFANENARADLKKCSKNLNKTVDDLAKHIYNTDDLSKTVDEREAALIAFFSSKKIKPEPGFLSKAWLLFCRLLCCKKTPPEPKQISIDHLHLVLAKQALERQDLKRALQHLLNVPKDPDAKKMFIELADLSKNHPLPDDQLLLLVHWFQDQKLFARAIGCYFMLKKETDEKALEISVKGLCQDLNFPKNTLNNVANRLKLVQQFKLAAFVYKELIARCDKDDKAKSPYYWALAEMAEEQQHYSKEFNYLLLALKADPKNVERQTLAFDRLIKLGDENWKNTELHHNAIQFYRWAHNISPNTPGPHIPRSMQYYLKNKDLDNASILFKTIKLSWPNRPLHFLGLNLEQWFQLRSVFTTDRKKAESEIKIDKLIESRFNCNADEYLSIVCNKKIRSMPMN